MDHPNIIKIHEYFQDKQNYYLVSELLSGGELYEWLNEKGTPSELEIKIIAR